MKTPLKEVSNEELNNLSKLFRRKKFLVGPYLERINYIATNTLTSINAYRAVRANQGLPNRGQRTHTNAKTARRLRGQWQATKYAKKMLKKSLHKKTLFDFDEILKRKTEKRALRENSTTINRKNKVKEH